MASQVPVISGREAVHVFGQFGWRFTRQSGSHAIPAKQGGSVTLSVPDHREVARGTLRAPIRSAGLTIEEFNAKL